MAVLVVAVFAVASWAALSLNGATAHTASLTGLLAASALVANLASIVVVGSLRISASFVASMLAVAFLGPLPALAVAVLGELGAWAFERRGIAALAVNIVGCGAPNVVAALVLGALVPADSVGAPAFYAVLALVALLAIAINFTIVAAFVARRDGNSMVPYLRAQFEFAPVFLVNVALTVGTASVYAQLGVGAAILALFTIVAFTYMAHLIAVAHQRARQYASLSWGVLSGLLRMLDLRDPRAARHSAAVAAFARDIAREADLDERDCELAHTAGLLHDIGRFALSDRVLNRGGQLSGEDWRAIQRHPELGAAMLGDLGVYGPVAEIIRAHHERLDGRGYPDALSAHEIPELAKIVAVAEAYDTLTADDTYRPPMSSFQALTELRRVAGTQFEGRYVESLARLLSGRSVRYRHADAADFGRELAIERRINQAAAR